MLEIAPLGPRDVAVRGCRADDRPKQRSEALGRLHLLGGHVGGRQSPSRSVKQKRQSQKQFCADVQKRRAHRTATLSAQPVGPQGHAHTHLP